LPASPGATPPPMTTTTPESPTAATPPAPTSRPGGLRAPPLSPVLAGSPVPGIGSMPAHPDARLIGATLRRLAPPARSRGPLSGTSSLPEVPAAPVSPSPAPGSSLSASSSSHVLSLAVLALASLLGLLLGRRLYMMPVTRRPMAFLSLIEWPG
jgi:hypothetical protein